MRHNHASEFCTAAERSLDKRSARRKPPNSHSRRTKRERSSRTQVQLQRQGEPWCGPSNPARGAPRPGPSPPRTLAGSHPGAGTGRHTCCGVEKLEGGQAGRGPLQSFLLDRNKRTKPSKGSGRNRPAQREARGAPFQDSPAPSRRGRFQPSEKGDVTRLQGWRLPW